MVPLGEQKQMEVVQTYKTSCRYVTYSRFGQLCLIIKEYIVILLTFLFSSKSKKLGKPHGPRPSNQVTVLRTDNEAGYWSFHCDTDDPSMVHQNRANRHFC